MIDSFIGRKCYKCCGADLVLNYQSGDVSCRDCGEVVSDRVIDMRDESTHYSKEDSNNQASRSSGMNDGATCSTQTGFINGPEHLRAALQRAQVFSTDRTEMVVVANLGTLNELCAKLNLSRAIQDQATELFRKTLTQRVVKSRAKEPVIASCIYLASRLQGYPRSIEEVCKFTGADARLVGRMKETIAGALALPLGQALVSPLSLVNRLSARLSLPQTVATHAYEMCREVGRLELAPAKSPQVVAGGVIVWAALLSRVRVSLVDLAEACLTEVAPLRAMFVALYSSLPLTVPAALKEHFCGEDGLMKHLPDKSGLGGLLKGDQTAVMPAISRPRSRSQVSVCKEMPAPSLPLANHDPEASDLLFNFEKSGGGLAVEADNSASLSTRGSSNSIMSMGSAASSGAGAGGVVATTNRRKTRLSAGGVDVDGDGNVCVSTLIKHHGSIFIPKKRPRGDQRSTA